MSETYSTTIPNIKDNDGDDVYLKIVFKKRYLHDRNFVEAEAFDSKGRYFYAEKLERDYEYYINKAEEWKLNDKNITYIDYEGDITIELKHDDFDICDKIIENIYSPYHLKSINTRIAEEKEKFDILIYHLKKKKIQIEKLYSNLNLM